MEQYRDEIREFMITTTILDRIYENLAKQAGARGSLIELFYALDDGKPHSQREICREWLVPKTTVNTLVQRCVREGYVILLPHSGTKEKEICLTEAGRRYMRDLLDTIYDIEREAYQKTVEKFSPDFVPAVTYFTNTLNDAFEAHFKNPTQEVL